MRKEDWLRLATPASICLLAASIFTMPLMSKADLGGLGDRFDPIHIKCVSGCY